MSKGYLIVASGDAYVKQAYLCALSIKATQSQIKNVSILTDFDISKKYKHVFDNIIIKDLQDESRYKTKLRSYAYDMSPYNETIVLDSDMLFTSDISYYWDILNSKDLFFTSEVRTYRNEVTYNKYYRDLFRSNQLPSTYVAMHYFKKSELAEMFYSLVKLISTNEKQYYQQILDTKKEILPSFDFTASLVVKILGIEGQVVVKHSPYPTFVHLKGQNQNWIEGSTNWTKKVPYYIDEDLNVFIGNFKQTDVLHYTENSFVDDTLIKKYENKLCK